MLVRAAKILSRVRPLSASSFAAGERPVSEAMATKQMLGADVFVLQPIGLGLREIGDQLEARREARLRAAVGRGNLRQQLAGGPGDLRRVGRHLAQHFGHDAFALLDERHQQVFRFDLRMVHLLGELLRAEHGFLRLFGVFVDVHHVFASYEAFDGDESASSVWSASKCERCSAVSVFGSWTSTVA